MKRILFIVALLFSLASQAQIRQQFAAVADNLDSLYTHAGLQGQYVVVLGRFTRFDGLGGIYVYDTTLATAEIPYLRFYISDSSGMWNMVNFLSNGSSSDTSIFSDPTFLVLDILSVPPSPDLGAAYIVLPPGAGAWIGHDNNVATGTGSGWTFDTAQINDIAADATDNNLYVFTAAGWQPLALNLLQNGNNYGPIDIVAGNKINKAFHIKTNNINRVRIDSIGRTYIYNTPAGTAGTDSVLVQSGGMVRKISATYYSTGGGGTQTTDYQTITATASQTVFTFTSVPATATDYWIERNGVVINAEYYSVAGNAITFTSGMAVGDKIGFHRIK